ncbi:MAG: ADP-ribosylglycohydrolase family protein [Spirochaetales bacterium]|jgi:ADP-ribosylglycohydrolase|nr:ADP-ribosylglycohydrolase family protein [Spirochaetales bacterium]
MKKEQRQGLIFGSLAADSLSLGSHWVYNTTAIEKRLGRPSELADPIVKTFHPKRKRGEFTHYGDQAFWLLEFLAETDGYDNQLFFELWKLKMSEYDGYLDHASKETMKNGKASGSDDLGGAGRTAPLACLYHDDPEALVNAAVRQAQLTHGSPLVQDVARFFSLLLFKADKPMDQAITSVFSAGKWNSDMLKEGVEKGITSTDRETTKTIKEFGQMCGSEKALPSVIHLLVTYPDNYREAMIANTAAGGDSAARGLLAGMILGSRLGFPAIPEEWVEPLVQKKRIETALERIGQLRTELV